MTLHRLSCSVYLQTRFVPVLYALCRVHLAITGTSGWCVSIDCTQKSQTLLLCAQVDSRVQSLSELYDGPQPSDVCDLLEGEQFFAGFERGLDISTGVRFWFRSQVCLRLPAAHSLLVSCRETRLCGGKTVLCVLLQPEEPQRSLHLCSRGSDRSCEGAGENITCSSHK